MCTVTYIPQADGYILTSNRDESATRATRNLDNSQRVGQQLVFPRDAGAGGTWIAISDADRTVCLLNGAFVKHHHRPPYKKSRGIMVLEFFESPTLEAFAQHYDFEGMEPFTMIVVERGKLVTLRWDERQLHTENLNPSGHYIWSSATLYTSTVQMERERWFQDWLTDRQDFSQQAILNFHKTGGKEDSWNGFIMNRNNLVQTVSITSIQKTMQQLEMRYESFVHQEKSTQRLLFAPSTARL